MASRPADGLITGDDGRSRCWWHGGLPDYQRYHDDEWGRPVDEDRRLFEKLCLEGFQSGLSWLTILRKREHFRVAFHGFDAERIAGYGDDDVVRLLGDAGIVRHRGKIESTINNARRVLDLRETEGSLYAYVQRYRTDTPTRNHPGVDGDVEGPQEARLELRRPHHRVCLHAGDGAGERPPRGLLRPARMRLIRAACVQRAFADTIDDDAVPAGYWATIT
jgi:DNA-3-methyladenine glycosylase I